MPRRPVYGAAYRVHRGEYLAYTFYEALVTGQANSGPFTIAARARVIYDEPDSAGNTDDDLTFNDTSTDTVASGNTVGDTVLADHAVDRNGWWVEFAAHYSPNVNTPVNAIWIQGSIVTEASGVTSRQAVCRGPLTPLSGPALGVFDDVTPDYWPTWIFQGTVAEDATGGTHNCTLTMSPGLGGAFQLLYGEAIVGATATAQTFVATIDDGTNIISRIFNPTAQSNTQSGEQYVFPASGQNTAALFGTDISNAGPVSGFLVSGSMRLVLLIQTAAVSVTQTFSVALRIRPTYIPTATLADTVGTPTLTTNTNGVF